MKKFIYTLIRRFGFRIENIDKRKAAIMDELSQYGVKVNTDLLYRANAYIAQLKFLYPDLRIEDHENGLMVHFDGKKIFLESNEEFFILKEVFFENDYGVIADKGSILVDIGMNIGISLIYFSDNPNIEKMYAFEPVSDTFEQAQKNIALNNLNDKTILSNFGLGKSDRKETFVFNKLIKGNTGVRGTLSTSYAATTELEERQVEIRDAATVFSGILQENPSSPIIVKMDCEGAEYEIMERLKEQQLLSKIDVFMIEWHDRGATEIEQALQQDFTVFSRRLAVNAGMIYATNRKKRL